MSLLKSSSTTIRQLCGMENFFLNELDNSDTGDALATHIGDKSDDDYEEYPFKANETPEHRRLRVMFLKEYKDKFEELELECLAQCLVNVEFLGCRYPDPVMLKINNLCGEILKDFRKGRQQRSSGENRTLVSADSVVAERAAQKYRRTEQSTSDAKTGAAQPVKPRPLPQRPELPAGVSYDTKKHYNLLARIVGFKIVQNDASGSPNVNYGNSLQKIFQEHREGAFTERIEGDRYECRYNGTLLVKVMGTSVKKTKAEGMEKVYRLLKNFCPFLVKIASHCAADDSVVQKTAGSSDSETSGGKKTETFEDKKIGADNIGYRMLKALGWEEAKKPENGIVDPIGLSVKIGRAGLGSEQQDKASKLDMAHFRKLLQSFKDSDTDFDLVFSNEFTKEERADLHNIAQKLKLKAKSEGKDENRFLVVRKNVSLPPNEVLEKVLANDPFYSAIWSVEMPELKEYKDLQIS